MPQLLDTVLMAALALNFFVLGVSRVRSAIHAVAWQGVLLGFLPVIVHADASLRTVGLVLGTIGLKGILIPLLLLRAMRDVNIQHEVKPLGGFILSLLLGAVGTALAMVFANTLELAPRDRSTLLVPASLSTVLAGFLILTMRYKAVMQVLGYLMLENGIFIFGMLLLEAMPFLVEIGVLLDVFTGVFVMGIIIHHINREFASTSTELLAELKE